MKKIAIITAGLLPMPDVKGGAIETLLEYTLEENEKRKKYIFDVYSIQDEEAKNESKKFKYSNFCYIDINQKINKIIRFFMKVFRKLKIDKDPNFQFLFIKNVFEKIKNENYDYIIVESENNFAYYLLKKGIDSKVILYLHNDKLNKKTKHAKFLVNKLFKIYCISDYIKRQVLTIDTFIEGKTKVIFNGIDYEKNIKYEKHNNINFLYTGRIEKEKGVLELIKAFNKIEDKNAMLYVVGGSFYSSNKMTKYSKKVYLEAKYNKNIVFLGYINHNKICELYKNIDAQIVPSIWEEPAGLVNMEALAYGVNLITTNVGGSKEVISSVSPKEGIIMVENDEKIIENLCNAMNKIKKLENKYKRNVEYITKEKYCERYFDELDLLWEDKV